jgi:hypothetical protein
VPNRTAAQVARKYEQGFHAWIGAERGGRHIQAAYRTLEVAGHDKLWRERVIDGELLAQGLKDGTFTIDTRLRDALRDIRNGRPPAFRPPTLDEQARFHDELGEMRHKDIRTRLIAQVTDIERRLAVAEGW